jgi:hypothetical protein
MIVTANAPIVAQHEESKPVAVTAPRPGIATCRTTGSNGGRTQPRVYRPNVASRDADRPVRRRICPIDYSSAPTSLAGSPFRARTPCQRMSPLARLRIGAPFFDSSCDEPSELIVAANLPFVIQQQDDAANPGDGVAGVRCHVHVERHGVVM